MIIAVERATVVLELCLGCHSLTKEVDKFGLSWSIGGLVKALRVFLPCSVSKVVADRRDGASEDGPIEEERT